MFEDDSDVEYEACEECGDPVDPLLLERDESTGEFLCGFCHTSRQD